MVISLSTLKISERSVKCALNILGSHVASNFEVACVPSHLLSFGSENRGRSSLWGGSKCKHEGRSCSSLKGDSFCLT
jgi:hypothetical protein